MLTPYMYRIKHITADTYITINFGIYCRYDFYIVSIHHHGYNKKRIGNEMYIMTSTKQADFSVHLSVMFELQSTDLHKHNGLPL